MRIISFAVLIIVLNSLGMWLTNLPQDVGLDVPEGKLKSLSFAPFREGQGPVQGLFPTPEQIDADLTLMGQKTHNIRTYASAEGSMPAIPELAKKHGVTMLQGAWLNPSKDKNKIEIAELIRSANAHPDVVKRVIVGNEVLLRGDLQVDQLIGYIREVKRSVKQPVSYADVWSMYMKYPQLIKEVDFITIHILPYWEDRPITVEEAPDHIQRIVKNVRQQADAISPNKPILIGESGWPGAGRQRGWSVPSVVNEAKFIRALIKVANDNGFDYNIVEAFNQPWKSAFEGVVGANWGLYSMDRQEVFPLTGAVYENPQWYKGLIASIIIFLIVTLRYWQALQSLPSVRLLVFLGLLQVLSVLLVSQMHTLWYTSYSDSQRLQTLVTVGLNILLGGLIMRRSYTMLANQTSSLKFSEVLCTLYCLVTVFAVYQTYQLAMEGRYLSFPTVATYIPVFGLVGLMVVRAVAESRWTWHTMSINQLIGDINPKTMQNKLIGGVLLLVGLALVVGETHAFMMSRDLITEQPEFWTRLRVCLSFTLTNCQLLGWLASLTVLALPLLIGEGKK
ncbi:MAG: exo-beta-1,3-glucanase [Methylococcaceae bacterium]|nr:exo-beta-1,3-glucanase [Methylococcaceae bacterium]